eukprot:2741402-Pyramimonas_sp.AAC.1
MLNPQLCHPRNLRVHRSCGRSAPLPRGGLRGAPGSRLCRQLRRPLCLCLLYTSDAADDTPC